MYINIRLDMDNYLKDLIEDIEQMESFDCQRTFEKTQRRIRARRIRISIVASFSAAAVLAAIAVLFNTLLQQPHEMLVAEAPTGQVVTVTLPDSSVVCLNSGSTLTYPAKFSNDKREVTIQGQGWFTVYASHSYPFYVHTPGGQTLRVYGTEFDVAAYPDENNIEVYLASGSLNIFISDKSLECTVKPGQIVTYDMTKGNLDIANKPEGLDCDWKTGNLIFRRALMSDILTTLSRRFDVLIDCENLDLDTNEYHASFTANETVEEILSQLSELSNISWYNAGVDADGKRHITAKYNN